MSQNDPVVKSSADINERRLEELKYPFPEAFTEGIVGFERFRAALDDTTAANLALQFRLKTFWFLSIA